MSPFNDQFSRNAAEYAAHRPRYPAGLFAELAARAPTNNVAWDCATGNGQAALDLAAHFQRVIATDASASQISAARRHERVTYGVALAEASSLRSASIDVVVVAQALHWFDLEAFFREVRRVIVARGVMAAWCYTLVEIDRAVDSVLRHFYEDTVGPYWSPERRLVDTGYRTIDFPFEEFVLPPLAIEQDLTLDQLGGYLRTWSATQRYVRERGEDPVAPLIADLETLWGSPSIARRARFPLSVRAGYQESGRADLA